VVARIRGSLPANSSMSSYFSWSSPDAPQRVIQVLSAPFGIEAGGLQVRVRGGGYPDVRPSRRNPECTNPLQRLGVVYRLPKRVENYRLLVAALAAQTKLAPVDVDKLIQFY